MARQNKIFIDANILLEIIYKRARIAKAIKLTRTHTGNMYVSTLTIHLVMYFGLKFVNFELLKTFLSDYTALSLEPADVEWAYTNTHHDDFEDALQLAVAIRSGCSEFMTFDKQLHAAYKGLPQIKVKLLA